jgi:hypothetical protein
MTLKLALALGGFAVILLARPALASTLTLCGVVDQSLQDLDPRLGFVRAPCGLVGGGTLSATAQETVTATMDVITLSPSLLTGTNPGVPVVFNTYNFPAGTGFEESPASMVSLKISQGLVVLR